MTPKPSPPQDDQPAPMKNPHMAIGPHAPDPAPSSVQPPRKGPGDARTTEEALARKEHYQHALINNFPFMVWLKDTESRFLAVNDAFAHAFGIDHADSLVGKNDFDIVPAEVAEGYRTTDREVLATRRQINLEEEIPGCDGTKWFETYKAPVLDDHGGLLGTVGFAREITARKEAEAAERARALSESERFFRATIDALPSTLCVLDENGRIIAVNKAWRRFAATNGGDPERMSEGADYLAACSDVTGQAPDTALAAADAIRELLAGTRHEFAQEYECSTPGAPRWYEMRITRFDSDGPVRLVVVHAEITESKLLAAEQRETAARLKRLAAHLDSVREEQSATIAREIHDELGGTLTMLKLGLATARDDLNESAPMIARVHCMLEQVDAALQTVKRIASNLRPAMLDTLGLIHTIKWYADQFARMTGIEVESDLPEFVRLPASGNMGVFRIIQESLTNVAKHSGASKVRIALLEHRAHLIVRIADNGVGMPDGSLHRHDSFGVIGMYERAHNLGGELSLSGTPQTGTQLTLRIPLDLGLRPHLHQENTA